jgi:CHAD domain-containing protein
VKICGHDNIKSMGDEERHQLRIEIKKLRYALDFMQALHEHVDSRQRQFTKAIEALQEALGRLNDIVTARQFARSSDKSDEISVTDEEVKCVHEAQKCLNRLKLTGPYWSKPKQATAS